MGSVLEDIPLEGWLRVIVSRIKCFGVIVVGWIVIEILSGLRVLLRLNFVISTTKWSPPKVQEFGNVLL